MLKSFVVALAIAGASLSTAAHAALIVNGSFETGPAINPVGFTTVGGGSGAITGWMVGGDSVDYIGSYWQAQDGARSIDLAGNGIGSLSQTIATISGASYVLDFFIGRNPDGGVNPRTGFVTIDGVTTPLTYLGAGTSSDMQWQKVSVPFSANGASTMLSFSADASANGAFGLALDNVSIVSVAAAVPEPATWGLMLVGFGLLGGALRRKDRRRRAIFA